MTRTARAGAVVAAVLAAGGAAGASEVAREVPQSLACEGRIERVDAAAPGDAAAQAGRIVLIAEKANLHLRPGDRIVLSVPQGIRIVAPRGAPALGFRDLRPGMRVRTVGPPGIAKSLPPQGSVRAVEILGEADAPPAAARRARLDLRAAPLGDALEALKAKLGLRYVAPDDVLKGAKPVTLEGELTLEEALAEIAKQAGVSITTGADGVAAVAAAPAAPAGGGAGGLFPLAEGMRWIYEESDPYRARERAAGKVTMSVQGRRTVGAREGTVVGISYEDGRALELVYAAGGAGIRLLAKAETVGGRVHTGRLLPVEMAGPDLFLKLPFREGGTWAYGDFDVRCGGEEEVEVPAGKFRCRRVDLGRARNIPALRCNVPNAGMAVRIRLWLADGVGIVRETWQYASPVARPGPEEFERRLVSFEGARAADAGPIPFETLASGEEAGTGARPGRHILRSREEADAALGRIRISREPDFSREALVALVFPRDGSSSDIVRVDGKDGRVFVVIRVYHPGTSMPPHPPGTPETAPPDRFQVVAIPRTGTPIEFQEQIIAAP